MNNVINTFLDHKTDVDRLISHKYVKLILPSISHDCHVTFWELKNGVGAKYVFLLEQT